MEAASAFTLQSAPSVLEQHDGPAELIVEAKAGLGNRLRPILSGLRIARASNRAFRVLWLPTQGNIYQAEVSHDLRTESQEAGCPVFGDWQTYFQYHLPQASKTAKQAAKIVSSDGIVPRKSSGSCFISTWRFIRFDDEPSVDYLLSDRITEEQHKIQQEMLDCLMALTPAAAIREVIDAFAEENSIDHETVGIHIRRLHPNCSKINMEDFILCVDKILPSKKNIILATDTSEVEDVFTCRYGSLVKFYRKRSRFRNEQVAIEDAIIDLFLLARAGHLLLSQGSTYSDLAWWLGSCRATNEYVRP